VLIKTTNSAGENAINLHTLRGDVNVQPTGSAVVEPTEAIKMKAGTTISGIATDSAEIIARSSSLTVDAATDLLMYAGGSVTTNVQATVTTPQHGLEAGIASLLGVRDCSDDHSAFCASIVLDGTLSVAARQETCERAGSRQCAYTAADPAANPPVAESCGVDPSGSVSCIQEYHTDSESCTAIGTTTPFEIPNNEELNQDHCEAAGSCTYTSTCTGTSDIEPTCIGSTTLPFSCGTGTGTDPSVQCDDPAHLNGRCTGTQNNGVSCRGIAAFEAAPIAANCPIANGCTFWMPVCPAGCAATFYTCDLDAVTQDTAECPYGCTNIPTPECGFLPSCTGTQTSDSDGDGSLVCSAILTFRETLTQADCPAADGCAYNDGSTCPSGCAETPAESRCAPTTAGSVGFTVYGTSDTTIEFDLDHSTQCAAADLTGSDPSAKCIQTGGCFYTAPTCTGTVTSDSSSCAAVSAFVASGAEADCPTGDGCTFAAASCASSVTNVGVVGGDVYSRVAIVVADEPSLVATGIAHAAMVPADQLLSYSYDGSSTYDLVFTGYSHTGVEEAPRARRTRGGDSLRAGGARRHALRAEHRRR
jgi:hypothetical protein